MHYNHVACKKKKNYLSMQNPVTDIAEADERDGIRFTFNTWPGTRMEATKCVVPMGCL